MIPLTFHYDEYIDQPKLSEQKNQFEYIVPPPTSGVGTIIGKLISFCFTFIKSAQWFLVYNLNLLNFSKRKKSRSMKNFYAI